MKIKCLLISLSAAWLSACDPGLPDQGAAGGDDLSVKGYAEPLSYSEFEGMAPLRQYQVANKLLATLYKGMPVDEFFDITAALGNPTSQYNGNLLRDLQVRLGTELTSPERKRIDAEIAGDDEYIDDEATTRRSKPSTTSATPDPANCPMRASTSIRLAAICSPIGWR